MKAYWEMSHKLGQASLAVFINVLASKLDGSIRIAWSDFEEFAVRWCRIHTLIHMPASSLRTSNKRQKQIESLIREAMNNFKRLLAQYNQTYENGAGI